jgi:hypothetical protein
MIKLSEQGNLANHIARYATFGRGIGKGNTFDRDRFTRVFLAAFVNL